MEDKKQKEFRPPNHESIVVAQKIIELMKSNPRKTHSESVSVTIEAAKMIDELRGLEDAGAGPLKMTAIEFIEEEIGDCHDNPNMYNEMLAELLDKYALQVATEAVEDYKKESLTGEWWGSSMACEGILKKIKKRLDI